MAFTFADGAIGSASARIVWALRLVGFFVMTWPPRSRHPRPVRRGRLAEGIEIVFDPAQISYRQILEFFFQIHDPTTLMRHSFPEVPPRVEYELTEMGAGLLPALQSLNMLIRDNLPRIEENRCAYDDVGH